MARRLKDWLRAYMLYTRNTEPPRGFHKWVALSMLSASLQRRVYFEWGLSSTIYPNQYIVLVGPSGLTRKGEALNIGRNILERAGLGVTSQAITKEALIKGMKESISSFMLNGVLEFQSPMTCISAELSVFLGERNVPFLANLTDWYDCAAVWVYETKHSGKDRIVGVCLNLLGATAPDWLSSMFPKEAIGGGFTSRTIFVVEEQKGRVISDPSKFPRDLDLEEDLVHDLQQVKNLVGEMTFNDDARNAYEQWYLHQEEGLKQGKWPVPDPAFQGYTSRRATHVKKVCMAISAARRDSLIITLEDFIDAKNELEAVERKMPRVFSGIGASRIVAGVDIVLAYVQTTGKAKRSTLLNRYYREIDDEVLSAVVRQLSHMKLIKVVHLLHENDEEYVFTGESPATDGQDQPLGQEEPDALLEDLISTGFGRAIH